MFLLFAILFLVFSEDENYNEYNELGYEKYQEDERKEEQESNDLERYKEEFEKMMQEEIENKSISEKYELEKFSLDKVKIDIKKSFENTPIFLNDLIKKYNQELINFFIEKFNVKICYAEEMLYKINEFFGSFDASIFLKKLQKNIKNLQKERTR